MSEAVQFLHEAIDRNAPAALTLQVNGLARLVRSRLLAKADDAIWAGLPPAQADAIDAMARAGESVRVNFRSQQTIVEFHARVLERRRAYQLNATTQIEAVRIAWPDDLQVVQRRAAYRVGLSSEKDLRVRCWRIEAGADLAAMPPADAEMTIDVRDFSATGVGGIWKRRRGEVAVLASDQRLRVDVTLPDGQTTSFDAYVRFLAGLPEPDYRRIGVQFMLSPTSLVDRQKRVTLNHVTGDLQRAELKRLRVAR